MNLRARLLRLAAELGDLHLKARDFEANARLARELIAKKEAEIDAIAALAREPAETSNDAPPAREE